MLRVRFRESPQTLTKNVASRIRSEVKLLADSLYREVRSKTPVDTGTAKAGWNKNVRADGFTISNNVSYIGVLDKGRHMTNRGMRGSKQAPRGIVGPSLESIKRKN